MPLEFLLSIHIATQMPDLAIDMATTFDTDVEVLLHNVDNGGITAGIKSTNGGYVEWGTIESICTEGNNAIQDVWNFLVGVGDNNWFSLWNEAEATWFTLNDQAYFKLFGQGFPHADDCGCCGDIPGSGKEACVAGEGETLDGNLTPGDDFSLGSHAIGSSCKELAKKIISALRLIQDNHWYSYTPYISKVTNHWFRDVYFVIENPSTTNVIKTDEDYFYETNERWTMYETYEDGDNIPEGFEPGDYILYEYEYDEATGKEKYTQSTLTKKEVEELDEKLAAGDTSVTKLIKKPIETLVDSGTRWIAYEPQATVNMDWTPLETTDQSPEILSDPDVQDLLYYKETRPGDIKQVEDGKRGVTNPIIKDMFINRKYYQYDGTIQKADAIQEDKESVAAQYTNEQLRQKINTDDDPRDKELLGKVSIAKDSLTAFSMLENTHTLDADYIYKDFKELIVELDYFDKEDLSDKIATVMQWPIPDCGSGGWPIRRYEKGETFYGTLINSMVDLELMRNADIEAAEKLLEELENEAENAEAAATQAATGAVSGSKPTGSIQELVATGYEVHRIMEEEGKDKWDYCILSDKGSGPHMASDCEDCEEQHCDSYNPSAHVCGLDASIQQAVVSHNNTCCATFVSWVLKEFGFEQDIPGTEPVETVIHGAKNMYYWAQENNFTPITDYNEMEAGDLLFNKSGYSGNDTSRIGHVQMLGDDGEWLNAGSKGAINDPPKSYTADFIIGMRPSVNKAKEPFEGYKPNQDVVSPVTGKITEHGTVERVNEETGKTEVVEFIKIEAIHNYLYDTTEPKGEGYLKCEYDSSEDEYDTFEDKASANAKKLEGYDYFYEEYQGVMDGFVLYIEGFDLTFFDKTSEGAEEDGTLALFDAGNVDTTDVTRYEVNAVYNMDDNLKEARAIWKEDAKVFASPIVRTTNEDGEEEIYIKEGTVIGKTYEDPDMTGIEVVSRTNYKGDEVNTCIGNGNYMRLIFRDLEDAIVEDVENYMIIDDVKRTELDYEFFFWSPYEGGAWGNYEKYMSNYDTNNAVRDDVGQGPTIIAVDNDCAISGVPWSIAVGIAQWTNNPSLNNLAGLCKYLSEFDSSLSILGDYANKDAEFFNNNLEAFKEDWYSICSTQAGYDKMVEGQMTYAYEEEWLNSSNAYYKGIAEWAQDRPMALQGFIFSVMNWGNYSYNGGKLLDPVEASKDDETILRDLTKNCIGYGRQVGIVGRWDSQAQLCLDLMQGKISEEQLTQWIEEKTIDGVSPGYGEGVEHPGWE